MQSLSEIVYFKNTPALSLEINCFPPNHSTEYFTAVQRQNAVSTYSTRWQIPPFAFAEQISVIF